MANTSRSEWPRVNVNQFSLPRYASLQNRPLYESSRLGPRLLSACPRVAASLSTSQFSPRGTTCSELRLLFITVCIGEYFILASETALKNTFLCTEFVARGNFGSLQHRHRTVPLGHSALRASETETAVCCRPPATIASDRWYDFSSKGRTVDLTK